MNIEYTCFECGTELELDNILENLSSSQKNQVIDYLLTDDKSIFKIPTTVEDEMKLVELKKLYKELTLEQIENIVKQFIPKA